MKDFNITRQIYLREFLIDYNKLYIPINSDDTEEEWEKFLANDEDGNSSVYSTYCYIIMLLKQKTLSKDKFFRIYQKDTILQKIGNNIVSKEKSLKLFKDFDINTKKIFIENTFKLLTENLLKFNNEYKKYDIIESDFNAVVETLKINNLVFSLEHASLEGNYEWHTDGLCHESKNTFLQYDYIIGGDDKSYLNNFYHGLKEGLTLTIIVECLHTKSNKKRSRFIQSLFKKDSFSKKFNVIDFGKITTYKLVAKNKNIFILCYLAHYLNLTKDEIKTLREILSISSVKTVKEKFDPLQEILFPNTTYL